MVTVFSIDNNKKSF